MPGEKWGFLYGHWKEFKDVPNRASNEFIKTKEIVHSQTTGNGQARRRATAPKNREA